MQAGGSPSFAGRAILPGLSARKATSCRLTQKGYRPIKRAFPAENGCCPRRRILEGPTPLQVRSFRCGSMGGKPSVFLSGCSTLPWVERREENRAATGGCLFLYSRLSVEPIACSDRPQTTQARPGSMWAGVRSRNFVAAYQAHKF